MLIIKYILEIFWKMHVEKCGGQTSKDNRLMPILDFETWSFMI
jgi:hypothetical protein